MAFYRRFKDRFDIWFGQIICDLGLKLISLGPKDAEDKNDERRLIEYWRKFEARKRKL